MPVRNAESPEQAKLQRNFARLVLLSLFLFALPLAAGTVRSQDPAKPIAVEGKLEPGKPYQIVFPESLVKLDMAPIPGGSVELSDPANLASPKKVEVKPFWMSKLEVRWDDFDVYLMDTTTPQDLKDGKRAPISRPSRPYGAPDHGFGHQGYPAVSVAYMGAEQFCKWLSLKTGGKYRLPTEAEWEHAARAGASSASSLLAAGDLEKCAWFWDNAEDTTHPAGELAPNSWGLHDMLGNALEWCAGLDGKPVARGGSFRDKVDKVQYGIRHYQQPSWNQTDPQNPKSPWWLSDGYFVGFRIVREP
jgi:formylglycine-generating enzyme required for sulfatase activity